MTGLLTQAEIDTLTRRLADAKDGTVTDRELEAVLAWAERAMSAYLALRVVLAGDARVVVEGGQVVIAPAWRVH